LLLMGSDYISESSRIFKGIIMRNHRNVLKASLILVALAALTSCGNTVRGLGQDTANMVHATKQAGSDVARSF
jgi:entericidin B